MIPRNASKKTKELAKGYPVVALTGPRQSGKTTLARSAFPEKKYVSLEDPDNLEFALSDPRGFLSRLPDGGILDEVQNAPSLFSFIQTRTDLDGRQGLFILTGSQQFALMSKITQSLAGRVGMIQLLPFSLEELQSVDKGAKNLENQLWTGFYPPLYDRELSPLDWYGNYVTTYLERDVRQLINIKDLNTFRRFLRMCAARIGQLVNFSGLGNDCGVTHNTVRSWLSVLEASYILFLVYPHHQNFGKRLVKTPKLYFYDTGLASWLLGIQTPDHLAIHTLRGPLFENLVFSELLKERFNQGKPANLYFWRNNTGDEIDIIVEHGDTLIPIEVKSGQTISRDFFAGISKWIRLAGASSGTPYLVYGGDEDQDRSGTRVVSWKNLPSLTNRL
jgi:predicted AAA+ superfamily ATPase